MVKWWEAKDWGKKRVCNMVGKNIRKYMQHFLHLMWFSLCAFLLTVFDGVYCVFLVPYVYLLYYVCIAVLTLDAGLLARSQYPEGPATGHLDTGFSWFPCVYQRMLWWFPRFQIATTYFLYSPPDLNFLVTFFNICVHVK